MNAMATFLQTNPPTMPLTAQPAAGVALNTIMLAVMCEVHSRPSPISVLREVKAIMFNHVLALVGDKFPDAWDLVAHLVERCRDIGMSMSQICEEQGNLLALIKMGVTYNDIILMRHRFFLNLLFNGLKLYLSDANVSNPKLSHCCAA